MKSQFVALAIVLAGLPALAWGQASCGCTSRAGSGGFRPTSYGAWADYQPPGQYHGGCNSCSSCAPACCDPCCRPLLCIIPNTVQKIGCVLDRLMPCGRRSCGVSCTSVSCSGGCPSCSSPAMGNPFQDDGLAPPMPPKPAPQETRRPAVSRDMREYASTPAASSKMHSNSPATKSVLTRAKQPAEEVVSRANYRAPVVKKAPALIKRTSAVEAVEETTPIQSARRSTAIPHNPLR